MADAFGRRVSGYDYRPNTSTEYTRFRNEYFSGADVRIYFGDIWVDEITSLQFTLQEQVAPIFGYASFTWDKVARGSRYVQGSFTINFKESYYLHSVMERLSSKMKENAEGVSAGFNVEKWKEGVDIEHLIANEGGNFDVIADEFEKSMWGAGQQQAQVSNRKHTTYFSPNLSSGTEINNLNMKELADNGFNILIGYGPMNEKDGMKNAETTHSIIGVQLTGVSQIVGGDGQPVQEQYSFIARDLDGDVTVKATTRPK
jgi:hypothetical protein